MKSPEFVHVACQVCGSRNADRIHAREFETSTFGRVSRELRLCTACGFLYASPRPSPEALDDHARRSDCAVDAASDDAELIWSDLAPLGRRMVAAATGGLTSGRWLDVGCGDGEVLFGLDLRRWQRLGLEPSATRAGRARARG